MAETRINGRSVRHNRLLRPGAAGLLAAAMGAALSMGFDGPARAETPRSIVYEAYVRVTLNGLKVAGGSFQTVMESGRYQVHGSVESSGVADLFEGFHGETVSEGVRMSDGIVPKDYLLRYVTGGQSKQTTIAFADGTVAETVNVPPLRKRGDWIEIQDAHLRSVADPLAAMIVQAESLADVCTQEIRSFDGAMRADLALSFNRMVRFEADGFVSDAVVCNAQFRPQSGYHGAKDSIAYLRDRAPISITFVPIVKTDFFAPVAARIGTPVGTIAVRAQRIGIRLH